MKTAPHFIVGLTAFAALGAGIVLSAEDPVLFDPQQAMLLVLADDAPGDANSSPCDCPNAPRPLGQ